MNDLPPVKHIHTLFMFPPAAGQDRAALVVALATEIRLYAAFAQAALATAAALCYYVLSDLTSKSF